MRLFAAIYLSIFYPRVFLEQFCSILFNLVILFGVYWINALVLLQSVGLVVVFLSFPLFPLDLSLLGGHLDQLPLSTLLFLLDSALNFLFFCFFVYI